MATVVPGRPPASFRIIAVVLLLWGLMGCLAAWSQLGMSAADIAALPEPDRSIWAGMPGWAKATYAGAVAAGLAGAIALLLRRALARPLFLASLVLVVVQFAYTFLGTDLLALKGAAATVPFPLFIIAMAVFQLWYAGRAQVRGWLR